MAVQAIYAVGLLVGCLLAFQNRCPLLIRSALVLAGNFIACNLVVATLSDYAPVAWFLFIDVACALILLWQPTGRTPAMLSLVYFAQLGLHYAHWAAGGAGDTNGYLSMLTVGGGLQIVFLIMGAANGDGRKIGRGRGSGRHNGVDIASGYARAKAGGE
jgi:hypothetical protein